MSSISSDLTYGPQLDPKTVNVLGRFHHRRRILLALRGIAVGIVVFLGAMSLVALCDFLWLLSDPVRWLFSGIGYALTLYAVWWSGLRPMSDSGIRRVARQVEATDPRLREDLLAAVELADPTSANGSAGFRQWLQDSVGRRAAAVDVSRLLPVGLIRRWLLAGVSVALAFAALLAVPQIQAGRRMARAMLPGIPIQRASLTELVILRPAPASGYVAEGDAVGVLVQIGGRPVRDVVMQWRNGDGVEGQTTMTPRVESDSAAAGNTLAHRKVYAANLSVGTTSVKYRIVGGDAITLWNELTPLPRPQVKSFHKRLQFPGYSQLPDRIEDAEHGDLKAIAGTKALVTIRFDEPVDDATIRFGNRGAAIQLDPVSGSDDEFTTTIPIHTPGFYQVDAVSRRSGLNNPFSPQYSIVPVRDMPPVAKWSTATPQMMIVSPLDVVHLSAVAFDDLPIDRVVLEFRVNSEPMIVRNMPLEESSRELQLEWDWDLLHRMGGEEQSIKLQSGDIVRTQVAAIDRNSQRGETHLLELLIAEEGFDTERHARMLQLKHVTTQVAGWSDRMRQWMESMQQEADNAAADGSSPNIAERLEEATILQEESIAILKHLEQVCQSSTYRAEAGSLELIGRGLADLAQEQQHWLAGFQQATGGETAVWKDAREKILRAHAKQAKQFAGDATRVDQYARHLFGEALTTGLVGDMISLQRSLRPMLDEQQRLPLERFPRYLVVTIGRLRAIDLLIEEHGAAIPDSMLRHLESRERWSDSWRERLQRAAEEPPQGNEFLALIAQFDAELRNQINHALIDGRLASTIHSLFREIRIQVGPSSDLVRLMAQHGHDTEKAVNEQKGQLDSNVAARIHRDREFAEAGFGQAREHLLKRLDQEESLQRSRPNVDLQFAADIKLMRRAMENVASNGYAPYRDEPAPTVYQNLAMAYQTLEAKHEADQWLGELRELMLDERRLEESAVAKVQHPSRLERFGSGMEWPVRTLQNTGIPWDQLEAIDRTRYNDDFNQARNRITMRRWSGDPMVSAEASLDSLQRGLSDALDHLDPRVMEARATIERYVLSLSELARAAAEQTRAAQQRAESRPDSQASTADELSRKQQPADQATRQTLESLVDFANTASLIDAAQRELARDADLAAARIQQAARQAEAAIKNATGADNDPKRSEALDQSARALGDLTEALEQTAAHFEQAENGQDLTESRAQLRQDDAARLDLDQLQERYERAEEMAQAAQSSPEEMMRQLEQELPQNEPMQQELSDIARRAVETAQRTLQQAAKEETAVSQSLERSDSNFQERKQRAASEIASLTRRTDSVDQSLLQAVERGIGWANLPDAKPSLDRVRTRLREAVNQANQMGGDQVLLSAIQQTAAEMAEAIESIDQPLQDLHNQSNAAQDQDIHKDESSRRRTQDQIDRFARDARSQQLRSENTEQQQWSNAKQAAGRRIQDAQRQNRDAENQQRQLQQRLDREPNNIERLNAEIAQAQQRIDRAVAAEQSAKDSREFAEQKHATTEARKKEIQTKKIGPFDKKNPAAQLAAVLSDEARQELGEISNALQQLAEQMQFGDQLRAPESQAGQLANQQRRIVQDVNEAAAQLRRAARHEQRLGQQDISQQLDDAADAVSENAASAAQQAAQSLAQASSRSEDSPQANQRVGEAAEQIQLAADQLARLLDSSLAQQGEAAASRSPAGDAEQQQAERLAQTLDELDRQMSESQPQNQQSDQQANQQANQQDGQQGDGAGQPQSNQAATAQEASPTIDGEVNSQSQQAARQRQQQLNPSQGQAGNQGEPTSQSNSQSSASESGSGEMPGGGMVDTSGIDRLGSEWGQLRERRTDDVTETRGATVSPQYRRELEAYFRAIARRAAEREEE